MSRRRHGFLNRLRRRRFRDHLDIVVRKLKPFLQAAGKDDVFVFRSLEVRLHTFYLNLLASLKGDLIVFHDHLPSYSAVAHLLPPGVTFKRQFQPSGSWCHQPLCFGGALLRQPRFPFRVPVEDFRKQHQQAGQHEERTEQAECQAHRDGPAEMA